MVRDGEEMEAWSNPGIEGSTDAKRFAGDVNRDEDGILDRISFWKKTCERYGDWFLVSPVKENAVHRIFGKLA